MQIIDNRKNVLLSFRDLKVGDVFIVGAEKYIKIRKVTDSEPNCWYEYNCIRLLDGEVVSVSLNEKVELVKNCKLILED
ncbi:hypothetical protein [uncultured Eubacterium sp.]|uniref:hypothetical protein n=1 Tax=uncultured Eubacterium sp. TaxID=165185 RepID=UPI002598A046|nr:hypothetical protein [uncultured Eubacterium sp.]